MGRVGLRGEAQMGRVGINVIGSVSECVCMLLIIILQVQKCVIVWGLFLFF